MVIDPGAVNVDADEVKLLMPEAVVGVVINAGKEATLLVIVGTGAPGVAMDDTSTIWALAKNGNENRKNNTLFMINELYK
jgi:hypothetical protein